MIRSVVIRPEYGDELALELARPDKTGIAVTNIGGLEPPKVDVHTFGLVTTDGSTFGSTRVQSRNLVLNFRLIPNFNAENSRRRLYRAFPIHQKVDIEVQTDFRHVATSGYVEAIEADIFSSEVSLQASMVCPNPYFRGVGLMADQTIGLYGESPMFEFPFEDIQSSSPSMVMSTIQSYGEQRIDNNGDIPCGFRLEIRPSWGTGNITFINMTTSETLVLSGSILDELALPYPFYDRSTIEISTEPGNKYARLLSYGRSINILSAITPGSSWVRLVPGPNQVSVIPQYTAGLNFDARLHMSTWYSGV